MNLLFKSLTIQGVTFHLTSKEVVEQALQAFELSNIDQNDVGYIVNNEVDYICQYEIPKLFELENFLAFYLQCIIDWISEDELHACFILDIHQESPIFRATLNPEYFECLEDLAISIINKRLAKLNRGITYEDLPFEANYLDVISTEIALERISVVLKSGQIDELSDVGEFDEFKAEPCFVFYLKD